jgi:hypothetical protein
MAHVRFYSGDHYIENKKLFKAVSFARAILAEGELPIQIAMWKAAKYYKVPLSSVAKEMGKFACSRKYRERE